MRIAQLYKIDVYRSIGRLRQTRHSHSLVDNTSSHARGRSHLDCCEALSTSGLLCDREVRHGHESSLEGVRYRCQFKEAQDRDTGYWRDG